MWIKGRSKNTKIIRRWNRKIFLRQGLVLITHDDPNLFLSFLSCYVSRNKHHWALQSERGKKLQKRNHAQNSSRFPHSERNSHFNLRHIQFKKVARLKLFNIIASCSTPPHLTPKAFEDILIVDFHCILIKSFRFFSSFRIVSSRNASFSLIPIRILDASRSACRELYSKLLMSTSLSRSLRFADY